jgi:hypothetical protein
MVRSESVWINRYGSEDWAVFSAELPARIDEAIQRALVEAEFVSVTITPSLWGGSTAGVIVSVVVRDS